MIATIALRLELLKMARELVINEYIDRRAQDHNLWVAQSDELLRTNGVRLQYPDFPTYPSEKDIIAKADSLAKFMGADLTAPPEPTVNVEKNDIISPPIVQTTEASNEIPEVEITEKMPVLAPAVESMPNIETAIEPAVIDPITPDVDLEVPAKVDYMTSIMEIFNKTNDQTEPDKAADTIPPDPIATIFNDDPTNIEPVEVTVPHLSPIVKIFKTDPAATTDLLPAADTEIARKITEYEMTPKPNSLASSIIPNWLLKKQQVKT
jgi:hypothetical protein